MPSTLRLAAFACLLSLLFVLNAAGQTPRRNEARELPPAQPLSRELAGAETHDYVFELGSGEFFRVKVEQKGIDVLLVLINATGDEVARMDSPNGDSGPEVLTFVADSAGRFMLEVKSLNEKADKGAYVIQREAPRAASAEDRAQAAAEREQQSGRDRIGALVDEVTKLINVTRHSTPPDEFQKALDKAAQGVALAQSIKNLDYESLFLFFTARLYEEKGEKRKAVEYYEKTLQSINADKETKTKLKFMEVATLRRVGRIYESDLHNAEEAIKLFNRGLSLYQEDEEDEEKGILLRFLGDSLKSLKFYSQAEGSYLKAIKVFQNLKLQFQLGATVGKLGRLYFDMGGRPADALRHLLESERLLEGSPADSEYQNTRLLNIGHIYFLYNRLHDREKAAFYKNKMRELEAKTKDPDVVFANKLLLADALESEGNPEEALKLYQEVLEFSKALGNEEMAGTEQMVVLKRMLRLYLILGKYVEAKATLDKAVDMVKDLSDHTDLVSLFEDFADYLFEGGAFEMAAKYYSAAMHILLDKEKRPKQVDFEQMAGVQNKWAKAQLANGNKTDAIGNFHTSLVVEMSLHQQTHLADMFEDRMNVFAQVGLSRLAIFFGKQSIALKQEMRRAIKSFPVDTQKSFLKGNRETYEKLVTLLLQEGRLGETIQVINMYQDEEFYDFDDHNGASNRKMSFTERESAYLAELQKLQSSLHASKENFIKNPDFDKLDKVMSQMEVDFAKPPDDKDIQPVVPDLADMRAVVARLSAETGQKTAAVYTVIGEDKFRLILVPPDGEAKSFESPAKADDLNEKILEFYAILQSPKYDPRPLGKELYDLILKPAEADLKKSGAQTLMWQLDGSLRYVPTAALWDGKRYLAERYRNVVFTRANREQMTRAVSPSWAGSGFGSSRARTVDLLGDGDRVNFVALPGVLTELRAIFRIKGKADGIVDGDVLLDDGFTRAAFYEAMTRRRPLVHISSHFAFRPGDDSRSFLLLGDGTALPLSEMKKHENLFASVEMLTLSACNTAATLPDASGKEIDGFAELAQRLGAGAVMATLWQVSDGSTPWLMQEFYATRQGQGKATKAEALRHAQLALLNGTADTKLFPDAPKGAGPSVKVIVTQDTPKQTPGPTRSDTVYVSVREAPLFERDERRPFAHPYYWSPFVLFGNWR